MAPSSPTALLLFTRTPEEEARHKKFVQANRHVNRRIAHQLIKHTSSCLRKAGIPVFVITSDQQKGHTFGQRLAAAFQEIFEYGFDNVIAVGNDTLTLTARDLQTAAALLECNQAVIGPTQRGGTYLIGLHRSVFSGLDFNALPWETESLFDGLLSALDVAVSVLKYQQDINNATDFHAIIRKYWACAAFLEAFQNLCIIAIRLKLIDRPRIPCKDILHNFPHRAPPSLSI